MKKEDWWKFDKNQLLKAAQTLCPECMGPVFTITRDTHRATPGPLFGHCHSCDVEFSIGPSVVLIELLHPIPSKRPWCPLCEPEKFNADLSKFCHVCWHPLTWHSKLSADKREPFMPEDAEDDILMLTCSYCGMCVDNMRNYPQKERER